MFCAGCRRLIHKCFHVYGDKKAGRWAHTFLQTRSPPCKKAAPFPPELMHIQDDDGYWLCNVVGGRFSALVWDYGSPRGVCPLCKERMEV